MPNNAYSKNKMQYNRPVRKFYTYISLCAYIYIFTYYLRGLYTTHLEKVSNTINMSYMNAYKCTHRELHKGLL
jgi:hypothetical protein